MGDVYDEEIMKIHDRLDKILMDYKKTNTMYEELAVSNELLYYVLDLLNKNKTSDNTGSIESLESKCDVCRYNVQFKENCKHFDNGYCKMSYFMSYPAQIQRCSFCDESYGPEFKRVE